MRSGSTVNHLQKYFYAATIAAHATLVTGFRQKDVRFYLELFLDWVDSPFNNSDNTIHNPQIMRFFQDIEKEGYLKKTTTQKVSCYRLSRVGLLEGIKNITATPSFHSMSEFLFIIYFVKSYRKKVVDLIKAEGSQFPRTLQIEIESIFNLDEIISQQINYLEKFLLKLQERILDNQQSSILAQNMAKKDHDATDIAAEIQKHHPYNFNHQKPLKKLISEIPEEIRLFELTQGGLIRNSIIWERQREMYTYYLNMVRKLRNQKTISP